MSSYHSFDPMIINDYLAPALENYLMHGLRPGHFLTSVLTNNLFAAANAADFQNIEVLGYIARHLQSVLPPECFGSVELVNAWLASDSPARLEYVEIKTRERVDHTLRV